MFQSETRTHTHSVTREYGCATCDRCGLLMDEAEAPRSGYHNLALLRFRAGAGSRFGEGRLIEGDFCDACLFELLASYVRVVDDEGTPDSADFYRVDAPRRLYAEHQLADAMAHGLIATMREWVKQAFDPALPRQPLLPDATAPQSTDENPSETL